MASTYLSKTPSSAGNRKTFTFSTWIKRSNLSSAQTIFMGGQSDGNNNITVCQFQSADTLRFYSYSSAFSFQLITDRLFRDTSAWMHIVVAVDTTQATSSNRIKIYINGVQETSFSTETYPSQNFDTYINNNNLHTIGNYNAGTEYFDGSMTHFHFVDGTAYDASTFGESDSVSSIWKPKTAPSVTYGTNGFFLKFENSGAMGTDSSGNSNTFTVSGTITQNVDTPSNNFATINSLTDNSSNTLANGNTKWTSTAASAYTNALSTLGFSSGKFYAEAKIASASTYYPVIGIGSSEASGNYGSPTSTGYVGNSTGSAGLFMHGDIQVDGSSGSPAPTTYTTGDIVGLAVDLDSATKTLKIYKNGTLDQTYTISAPLGFYHFGVSASTTATDSVEFNFGQGYFGTTASSFCWNCT
jgi:hypothetical protein